MSKSTLTLIVVTFFVCLSSLSAFAEGGANGGGGDPDAQSFVSAGYKTAKWLKSVNSPYASQFEQIVKLWQESLDVLEKEDLVTFTSDALFDDAGIEKPALFNRNKKSVIVNRPTWKTYGLAQRIEEVSMEILGIIGEDTQRYSLAHSFGEQWRTIENFSGTPIVHATYMSIPYEPCQFAPNYCRIQEHSYPWKRYFDQAYPLDISNYSNKATFLTFGQGDTLGGSSVIIIDGKSGSVKGIAAGFSGDMNNYDNQLLLIQRLSGHMRPLEREGSEVVSRAKPPRVAGIFKVTYRELGDDIYVRISQVLIGSAGQTEIVSYLAANKLYDCKVSPGFQCP